MQTFIAFLNEVPLAGLMLVVALGYTLGRQSIRGISLGPAGGTLAVALLVGFLGLSFRDMYGSEDPHLTLGTLGFALFIYSVGLEAGPRFLQQFARGRRLEAGRRLPNGERTRSDDRHRLRAAVRARRLGHGRSAFGSADQRSDLCCSRRGVQQSADAHAQLRADLSIWSYRHGAHGGFPASRYAG